MQPPPCVPPPPPERYPPPPPIVPAAEPLRTPLRTSQGYTLAEAQEQKDILLQECEQLTLEAAALRQQISILEADHRAWLETNAEAARELQTQRDEINDLRTALDAERHDLAAEKAAFEKRSDVQKLTAQMESDKCEYDAMVSSLEKKHQKTLQEMRADRMGMTKADDTKRQIKEAVQEHERKTEQRIKAAVAAVEEKYAKQEKESAKQAKTLAHKVEQLKKNLEDEKTERKSIELAHSNLRKELLEGQEKHELEANAAEEKRISAVNAYEERLAIAESMLDSSPLGSPAKGGSASFFSVPRASAGSPKDVATFDMLQQAQVEASPKQKGNKDKPKNNFEEVMRLQEQLLEQGRRKVETPTSSSAGRSPPVQQFHEDVSPTEDALRRDMEDWILGRCMEMGIDDVRDLDSELRAELERAYQAR